MIPANDNENIKIVDVVIISDVTGGSERSILVLTSDTCS